MSRTFSAVVWALRNISAPGALLLSVRTLDPMIRFRRLSAVFALAAFVAGGLVGPALHRAAHGIEHAHHVAEAAAQTDHVHTDVAAFTVALDAIEAGHDLCLLCLPQSKTTPASHATSARYATAHPFAPVLARTAASGAEALAPIRGPPAIA